MKFTEAWFEDEVRDGFYIPALMKRGWAAGLEMLATLAEFWEERGIRWAAADDTLLGAVLCQGFLPWSDRITVSMGREDLLLFAGVSGELPEGLTFTGERVVNGSEINWSADFLARYHGFPYAAAVEIRLEEFTDCVMLDFENAKIPAPANYQSILTEKYGDYRNTQRRKSLCNVHPIAEDERLRDAAFADGHHVSHEETGCDDGGCLRDAAREGDQHIKPEASSTDYPYFMIQEHRYNQETNMVSRCFYRFHRDDLRNPSKDRDEKIVDNFLGAFTEAHRQVLRTVQMTDSRDFIRHFTNAQDTAVKFGNFIEVNYPQVAVVVVPILEAYCNRLYLLGESLTAAATPAGAPGNETNGSVATAGTPGNGTGDNSATAGTPGNGTGESGAPTRAPGNETGDRGESAGKLAAHGFEEKESASEHMMSRSDFSGFHVSPEDCLEACMRFASAVQAAVHHEILEKREIVFLPFKASGWKNLEPLYRYYKERHDCRVCVVPVPYFHVTDQNAHGEKVFDGDNFPDDVDVIPYETFNLYTHRPDTIVTQCPYDQYSMGIRLSADLYAGELQKFTRHLIYVPWFTTDETKNGDSAAIAMSDYFVLQPGVTMSDIVLVPSPETREFYIDRLFVSRGGHTRQLWEKKIQTIEGSVVL